MEVDLVSAKQIKEAQQFDQSDRKNETIVHVLKQACSRNKAVEKKELWDERHRQDHGSKSLISLKSNDGDFHAYAKIPDGAHVTLNSVNKWEEDRKRYAAHKEDNQLSRFCDGQDTAWRPDSFFTEVCSQQDVPPWPIRPTELFTNPHITFRIRAEQFEKRKAKKAAKKLQKEMMMRESTGEMPGEYGSAEEDDEDEDDMKRRKKEKKDRKRDKAEKKAKKEKRGKKEKKGKEKTKMAKEKKGKKEKKDKKEKNGKNEKKEKKERRESKDEKKERERKDRSEKKDVHESRQKADKHQLEKKAEMQMKADGAMAREQSKHEASTPKVSKESSKESRKRSREESPAPEQAEEQEQASSQDESSDVDNEERESSVHEVESTSEANWECSDSGVEGA